MQPSRHTLSKIAVLVGAVWIIVFTLNPPRCTIDSQGQINREESAPLYSRMFHHVERPMPQDGSSRQYVDRSGKVWQTTGEHDPAELDWTRYILGLVLLVITTCTIAFLISFKCLPRKKKQDAEQGVAPDA